MVDSVLNAIQLRKTWKWSLLLKEIFKEAGIDLEDGSTITNPIWFDKFWYEYGLSY